MILTRKAKDGRTVAWTPEDRTAAKVAVSAINRGVEPGDQTTRANVVSAARRYQQIQEATNGS